MVHQASLTHNFTHTGIEPHGFKEPLCGRRVSDFQSDGTGVWTAPRRGRCQRLARLMGRVRALEVARVTELVFLSEPVSAEQLCAWNVVNRLVDEAALRAGGASWPNTSPQGYQDSLAPSGRSRGTRHSRKALRPAPCRSSRHGTRRPR